MIGPGLARNRPWRRVRQALQVATSAGPEFRDEAPLDPVGNRPSIVRLEPDEDQLVDRRTRSASRPAPRLGVGERPLELQRTRSGRPRRGGPSRRHRRARRRGTRPRRAMFRMWPPATLSWRERCGSRGARSGSAPGSMPRQISARCSASGNGNSTTNRIRRRNAGSSAACMLRRQDRQAAIGLHPLEQVADLDVRVAIVAVADLGALAEQRVRLVEQEDRAAALGRVEQPLAGSSPSRRCTC